MKIAIIGTGISGLTAAYLLHRAHDIEVFEVNDTIGGHTNTITVPHNGSPLSIDTGFIVYNTATYPNLTRLFDELNVPTQWSNMTFSVRNEADGFEYGSEALFTRPGHLFQRTPWLIIADFLRFGREAKQAMHDPRYSEHTFGEFVREKKYSSAFVEYSLIPAASAIWSAPHAQVYDFPAQYFFYFYHNHGLLEPRNAIRWRTVTGGSQVYVQKMTADFRHKIHLRCGARAIRRHEGGVTVTLDDGSEREFDHVVIATHSDQALKLLTDPSEAEAAILGKIPYAKNLAILHTDSRVLPRARRAWSAWNYTLYASDNRDHPAALTYWMNCLQSLNVDENYCVTVNPREGAINPQRVIQTIPYTHPTYSAESLHARRRLPEINGQRNTHFCGAYFGYGFHEDGMKAGLAVAKHLGVNWE